ncbi:unnamed protein product, partial [Ectocarpus sp. 12 AP-2014]
MRPTGGLSTGVGGTAAAEHVRSSGSGSGPLPPPYAWVQSCGGSALPGPGARDVRSHAKLLVRATRVEMRSPWMMAASPAAKGPAPATAASCVASSSRRLRRQRSIAPCAALAYDVGEKRVLPDDARDALAQGDVFRALLLLEDDPAGNVETTEAPSTATTTKIIDHQ